jgi:hypothetical protein
MGRSLTVLGAAAFVAACSSSPSYIVLKLERAGGPIVGVTSLVVHVSKGTTEMATLTYPAAKLEGGVTQTLPDVLSVELDGGHTGIVTLVVEAKNASACTIGRGQTTAEIRKGSRVDATIALTVVNECPTDGGTDGGTDAPDDPDSGILSGCDPLDPSSADAGAMCAANQTCQINCGTTQNPRPRNECTLAGNGAAGALCPNMNMDCRPGSQCFDYAGLGCNVKVCLKFCDSNADCADVGAGGGGPGSVCEGPVQCGTRVLTYRTCTFNCDPTAAAAANRGGCPMGLACITPAAMDQVDCSCGAGRTRQEGEACPTGAECAPGLLCNEVGAARNCRPICRCDKSATDPNVCTAASSCPTTGTTCRPVANNARYGICVP